GRKNVDVLIRRPADKAECIRLTSRIEEIRDAAGQAAVPSERIAEIALRIRIDEENSQPTLLGHGCEQPRGVCFADTAFEVQDGKNGGGARWLWHGRHRSTIARMCVKQFA